MDRNAVFVDNRDRLFRLAYRMLGSVAEAEDVVQESWIRWQRASDVSAPRSYLDRIVTRLCIDQLRAATRARQAYVGPWLPEPIVASEEAGPEALHGRRETLALGFLALLERLTPLERAVYVLREALDYDYDSIAAIVDKKAANCRQLYHRACKHLSDGKVRSDVDYEAARAKVEQLLAAIGAADVRMLERLLAEDAVICTDGGGRVRAALKPVRGAASVARFIVGVTRKAPADEIRIALVNGSPGLVAYTDGRPVAVLGVSSSGGRIDAIYAVLNPAKLGGVPALC
ncbi:MAG: sigma-70 family RNA polymerase sigma factor [Deltaproteobacteria bacterium]|nr:MAG: sigma-70 family RNA polymerase sigma factor [Deltaproteobacteria bacterium]